MGHGSKRRKFNVFFSRLFTNTDRAVRVGGQQNGVEGPTHPADGMLNNAQNVVIQGSTMIYHPQITNAQGDQVTQAMRLLVQHIIPGAAHDSSARDPPPQCHPGTRIKLNGRITTWFYDKKRQKALLWISGPAGVGKSAVVQTFAESIASSEHLAASVFFSRPNKRNDPHRTFITIAYQLATRIEAYRIFVAEQLALDPDLLNKEMKEQFRILIIEPFAGRRIGAGGHTWGVLLDGLDEVAEKGPQRKIIRLISTFVLKYPEAPLVWVISSRPEPHICDTFREKETVPSYWQEYIPIDSTEACQDVERFLRASFNAIQNDFPLSVPKAWPSERAFLKLAGGSSGLFVFADVAIRFIGDPDVASPGPQLELVLSTIERSRVLALEDQPFAHLDALYTQILVSIPPRSWSITKRLLGFALFCQGNDPRYSNGFRSQNLKAISVTLSLEQDVIYGSLNKCYSILKIPPPEDAYSKSISFFHASFADYLTDSTRSKDFHISRDDAEDDVAQGILHIMQDFVLKESPRRSQISQSWDRYCSQYHPGAPGPVSPKIETTFNNDLFSDSCSIFFRVVRRSLDSVRRERQNEFEWVNILGQVDILDLQCNSFIPWLQSRREETVKRGLVREVPLEELNFEHHDDETMYPRYRHKGNMTSFGPCPSAEGREIIAKFKSWQREIPQLKVLILGSRPEIRNVLIHFDHHNWLGSECYVFPYPY